MINCISFVLYLVSNCFIISIVINITNDHNGFGFFTLLFTFHISSYKIALKNTLMFDAFSAPLLKPIFNFPPQSRNKKKIGSAQTIVVFKN